MYIIKIIALKINYTSFTKKYIIPILFLILIVNTNNAFANYKDKDTCIVINKQIEEDLDSLVNLWYIKLAVNNDTTINYLAVDSNYILYDSIIVQQLHEIQQEIRLTYNDKVKAFINLYANKRHRQVSSLVDLSRIYDPIIEPALNKYNLPIELKYLPIIESAFNQRAVSRAGATGLWQFMYTTGKLYNLEINSYVDERRDPVKSSEAAAKFLNDLYKIYHDWTLVIAAYNCGPGNVNKAIKRSGGKKNFWEIYDKLPRETRGYVPAFIAADYIMHYYKDYKIVPNTINFPTITDTIIINKQLHLQQVADVLGINIDLLRDLNPQYRKDIIPAKETKPYSLRLPFELSTNFIDLQDSIFAYKDTIFFGTDKPIINPPKLSNNNYYTPPPPSKDMKKIYYTVKNGDNVGYIAEWYNIRVSDLRYWNNIHRNLIRGGQKLLIYVPKNKFSHYKRINSMSFESKQKMIGKTVTAEKTTKKKYPKDSKFVYYTVRRGDNFWTIARKYPGVSNTDIMQLNNINNERGLKPGQKLKIKPKS